MLVGALIFGLGMQLGGGCGSGTLFTVGGGNARMLVTLAFFIVGALLGTAHLPWWLELPSFAAISLGSVLGVPGGIAVTLARSRRRRGRHDRHRAAPARQPRAAPPRPREPVLRRALHGPWPLVWGGLILAGLNLATLLIAGHPWSITYGFGLWGAKIAAAVGVPVATWEFWTWPGQAEALSGSVLADTTSVMDFGIILGAALAAGLAGKFAPKAALPILSLLAAAIGGLLMGYGARLSFGCNIGALFSGIASGSLHGWLWFGAAFVGSLGGISPGRCSASTGSSANERAQHASLRRRLHGRDRGGRRRSCDEPRRAGTRASRRAATIPAPRERRGYPRHAPIPVRPAPRRPHRARSAAPRPVNPCAAGAPRPANPCAAGAPRPAPVNPCAVGAPRPAGG